MIGKMSTAQPKEITSSQIAFVSDLVYDDIIQGSKKDIWHAAGLTGNSAKRGYVATSDDMLKRSR